MRAAPPFQLELDLNHAPCPEQVDYKRRRVSQNVVLVRPWPQDIELPPEADGTRHCYYYFGVAKKPVRVSPHSILTSSCNGSPHLCNGRNSLLFQNLQLPDRQGKRI